jgi:hypothetical protein
MGKKKSARTSKHTDPLVATKRNLKSEINKCEKKIDKLLKRYADNKKRKNCKRKIRDGEGGEKKTVLFIRLQGMKRDGEKHLRMLAYVESLKSRLSELK